MTDLIEKVETFQSILLSHATGGRADDDEYRALRRDLLDEASIAGHLPRFVKTCRDLRQFWAFIKAKYGTYQERRAFIWEEFGPVLQRLEATSPAEKTVSDGLESFDADGVYKVWGRALERRESDPEGAITSARTLLETVCKHILDDAGVEYDEADDLPKLYRKAAKELNLAPDQHTEDVFKRILGGCTAVVEGLGAVRNKLSDSHGKGKKAAKPTPRHASLAVNLAGAMATFLVETHKK